MRLSKVATLALIVATPSLMSVPLARAASDCSISVTLADWDENSTGYIDLKSGGSSEPKLARVEIERLVRRTPDLRADVITSRPCLR